MVQQFWFSICNGIPLAGFIWIQIRRTLVWIMFLFLLESIIYSLRHLIFPRMSFKFFNYSFNELNWSGWWFFITKTLRHSFNALRHPVHVISNPCRFAGRVATHFTGAVCWFTAVMSSFNVSALQLIGFSKPSTLGWCAAIELHI